MVLRDIFKRSGITLADAIIIVFVACVGIVLALSGFTDNGIPTVCVVEINGTEYARYDMVSLTEEKIINIDNEYGKNTVVIDRNGAAVIYSDCTDGIEVKAGRIDHAGQCLICLPHRLTVRLEGKDTPDGVSW
ncbi:MAG: NusG domain II-containing protein [Clostridia bacterium]|nr:NusG domain II-containing protein [Clostridia bacterium]